ncbi:hypothetical protein FA13DRAFT_896415 [Coprinellus micaceus]|uniref:F-box domain-containing protein n=1 Tax=Coprinellus micaceus TaxID=71717 RepID=A0A4Y7TSZ4_COPMI|nr:hypothetical protein FA13DRAFT_896415 [Coprinellus micaceus]
MDLSHLFLSNDVPRAVEVSYIQHKVDEAAAEIASLQKRLTEALSRQERYKTLLSPMRRLPDEMLGIFETLLDAMPPSECRRALASLCLVCKAWHDAALSTHTLWTRLEISADIGVETSEKAGHWLERAGSLSRMLAVRSCGHFFDDEECPLVAQSVIADLVAGGAIADLLLHFSFQTCFQEFTTLLDGRLNSTRGGLATTLDSLKLLHISIDNEANGVSEDPFPPILPADISISLSLSQWSTTMDGCQLLPRLGAGPQTRMARNVHFRRSKILQAATTLEVG